MSRAGAGRWATAIAVGALLLVSPGASAQGGGAASATRAEAAALARKAATDDAALERLRALERVGGRPVDLVAATDRLGTARAGRLRALADELSASGSSRPTASSQQSQRMARKVLADRKYQEHQLPKPFKGIVEWIADRLRPIGRALAPVADAIEAIPGGGILLVLLLGGGAGALVWWFVQRRSGAAVDSTTGWTLVDPGQDPDELEREADAALAAGDHGRSLRCRYDAGLLRLARAERIVLRPDTTAAAVDRQLDDPLLHDLTATFEAVVYGGQPADEADANAARDGWRTLLASQGLAVGGRR